MNCCRIQSVMVAPDREIVARLLPGTDLIRGIKIICSKYNIESGTIVSLIGSLKYATMVHIVTAENARLKVAYSSPNVIDGPLELLSAQGFIGNNVEKKQCVHLHGCIAGTNMRVLGGHFIEEGNPVLVTAELVIRGILGVDIVKKHNDETGFEVFEFVGTS